MRIDTWAGEVRDLLAASGVPVAIDVRDLRVPGALLSLKSVHPDRLGEGPYSVVWSVAVVAQAAGGVEAYRALGSAAAALTAVVRPDDSDMTAETLGVPGANDPLPALLYTITTECED